MNAAAPLTSAAAASGSRPSALEVFDSWARQTNLSEEAVRVYRSIWLTWLRYLAREEVERSWHQGQAVDVDGMLESLEQRRTDGHRSSHVSRRRYWKVLSRVYEHARACGWCRSNPTHRARAVPRSEEAASVVLPPAYLDRLREMAQAFDDAYRNAGKGQGWIKMRDCALLAVTLGGGLTTSELVALQVSKVLAYAPMGIKVLRVDGQRPAQRRDVPLEPWASTVLQAWLDERSRLMGSAATGGAVFVGRKGHAALSAITVHQVTQGFVEQLEHEFGTRIAHRGANLLRSSVVAQWLRMGMTQSDVLARAGLDTATALRRLQHVMPQG
jgi:site-specific recombinase XerD